MHGTSLVKRVASAGRRVVVGFAGGSGRVYTFPVAGAVVVPAGGVLPSGRLAGCRTVLPAGYVAGGRSVVPDSDQLPDFFAATGGRGRGPGVAVLGAADRCFFPTSFGATSGDRSRPGSDSTRTGLALAGAGRGAGASATAGAR